MDFREYKTLRWAERGGGSNRNNYKYEKEIKERKRMYIPLSSKDILHIYRNISMALRKLLFSSQHVQLKFQGKREVFYVF